MKHKNYSLREMLFDKCLQNGRAMTSREMMDYANRYLEENGFEIVKSRTTFMHTIDSMKANHHVRIQKERRHNKWYYWYEGGTSIFKCDYTADDYLRLKRLLDEQNGAGIDFLIPLLHAIEDRRPLLLDYHKFNCEHSLKRVVHPYRVKYFLGRWYLLAWNTHGDHLSTFGMDRIVNIERCEDVEYREPDEQVETYFNDMVGVTRRPDDVKEEVVLRTKNRLVPFLRSRKIHASQQFCPIDDEYTEVRMNLIINPELVQELLQYAGEIAVVSPDSLRETLKKRFLEALKINDL